MCVWKTKKWLASVAERQSDRPCGETKTRGAVCVREMLGVSRHDLLPLAIVETSGWRVGRIKYILNFKTRAHIGNIAKCANAPMLASIRAATFQWRAEIRHRHRRRRRWTKAPSE